MRLFPRPFQFVFSKYTGTGRHEAFFKSKCAQEIKNPLIQNIVFQQEEMVKIEQSMKVLTLFQALVSFTTFYVVF